MRRAAYRIVFLAAALLVFGVMIPGPVTAEECGVMDAITFASEPGMIYLPLEEAARELHLQLGGNDTGRSLVNGTRLVSADELRQAGCQITWKTPSGPVSFSHEQHGLVAAIGLKRVEVSLGLQTLDAWQGERLVLHTRISSGRYHSTPAGDFVAGPYKSAMHYSHLFAWAPMPWSVQIHGHVFIHGFSSVPDHPASHGCVRLPLDGGNPAKFFYEWIDVGVPVRVVAP